MAQHCTGHSKDPIQTYREDPMALGMALQLIRIGHVVLHFINGLNLAWQVSWIKVMGLADTMVTCLFGSCLPVNYVQNEHELKGGQTGSVHDALPTSRWRGHQQLEHRWPFYWLQFKPHPLFQHINI